ncbi:MAG: HAMP domain-containing protein [Nitrospinae bacterium]|nr:HAMP domain-containing protein [Nitrospinota bacterium]
MSVRGMRLRTKIAGWIVCLVLLLTLLVMVVSEHRERKAIEGQVQKRGRTIAGNLAALSTNALLTYNYVTLEQHVERLAREEDVVYVIILDREGRVAAYNGRSDLQGQYLPDLMARRAAAAREPLIQTGPDARNPRNRDHLLEIAIPVFPTDEEDKWGTVRVGISLRGMHQEIQRTRLTISGLGVVAAFLGCLAALFLARRITEPLEELREGAVAVAEGDLAHRIAVSSADEIGELADTFNRMTTDLQAQRAALQRTNLDLDAQLKAVSKLEQYNDRILKSMTNGLLTLDLEGRIVKWNDMAAQITGYPVSEVEDKPCQAAFAESPQFTQILLDGLQGKGVFWDRSVMFACPDGREVPLEINTTLLEDEVGHITGVLGVFRDLSLVRELEQRLRRADRLATVGRMAAMVAHEIKNPLVALKTFIGMLPRRANDPAFLAKFHEIVPREVERVNTITEDLLELSRPPRIYLRPLDVQAVIDRCVALHEHQAAELGVTLLPELAPMLPQVKADPEYLQRALGNLVLNGLQAMPMGGVLTLRSGIWAHPQHPLARMPGYREAGEPEDLTQPLLFIAVTDTGTGMTPEQLDSLFTPFFTTKEKGTGLGLALTHKIIEEHQGHLQVESRLGIGSTFTILLPVSVEA